MRKLTIRSKVNAWYIMIMVFILSVLMVLMIQIMDALELTTLKSRLTETVVESVDEIEIVDGLLTIDRDLVQFQNGVYLAIYDTDHSFVYGQNRSITYEVLSFENDTVQTLTLNGEKWNVYDFNYELSGYGTIWIRGVTAQQSISDSLSNLILISLILLPIMILLASLGGDWVTRRAFGPIRQLKASVSTITNGNDLSRRIELNGNQKDDIVQLANEFDSMFDRLEQSFLKEKQFASDASHELRTPITVIDSEAQYALEHAETLDEAKESLNVILAQTQMVHKLIASLLLLTRADQKNHVLNIETVQLSELCDVVVEELAILAEKKKISIETHIEQDIVVQADEALIIRVLINLINNAIQYSQAPAKIIVSLYDQKDVICLEVKDFGIGISSNNLSRLWDRFYQVDPARTKSSYSGNGLGLSMVKWIAEAHGGTVSVTSRLQEGSCFIVELPK